MSVPGPSGASARDKNGANKIPMTGRFPTDTYQPQPHTTAHRRDAPPTHGFQKEQSEKGVCALWLAPNDQQR